MHSVYLQEQRESLNRNNIYNTLESDSSVYLYGTLSSNVSLTLEHRCDESNLCLHTQASIDYKETSFYEETDEYWPPASNAAGLYEQLNLYRFRELPRQRIK